MMGEERWANNTGLSCSPFTLRVRFFSTGVSGAIIDSKRSGRGCRVELLLRAGRPLRQGGDYCGSALYGALIGDPRWIRWQLS